MPGTRVKRRTIGHYGIGMLAVGQLASTMHITSKTEKSLDGFTAEIDFEQFESVVEEGATRSTIKDESALEKKDPALSGDKPEALKIGECRLTKDRYASSEKARAFTQIRLTGVRQFVYKHLVGELPGQNPQWQKSQSYSAGFQDLLRLLREKEPNIALGWYPYENLVWEMGVYCPVGYPAVGEFGKEGRLHAVAQLAAKSDFSLKIDGIVVKKPFESKFFDDTEFPVEEVFSWKDATFLKGEKHLRCSGYLIFKRRIRPKSLQGILVRESGVAIGTYDTTYLHYPFNEGQKFNQLTGEVFAEGLSGALNIDRNSFNETDDTYIALTKWIHKKLHEDVFTRIKVLQSSPQAARRAENRQTIKATLSLAADDIGGKFAKVVFVSRGKKSPLLSRRGRTLEINQDHPDGSGSGAKREKALFAAALVLKGLAEPAQITEIEAILQKAKKTLKGRG